MSLIIRPISKQWHAAWPTGGESLTTCVSAYKLREGKYTRLTPSSRFRHSDRRRVYAIKIVQTFRGKPIEILFVNPPVPASDVRCTQTMNPSRALMAAKTSLAYRIHLHQRGPTSAEGIRRNLRLEEVPKPQPGPGQVLVRMKAAALNCRWIAGTRAAPSRLHKPLADGR